MSWLSLSAGILVGLIVAVLVFGIWLVRSFYQGY